MTIHNLQLTYLAMIEILARANTLTQIDDNELTAHGKLAQYLINKDRDNGNDNCKETIAHDVGANLHDDVELTARMIRDNTLVSNAQRAA